MAVHERHVAAWPLNVTVLPPCDVPNPVPVIAMIVPHTPLVGETAVIVTVPPLLVPVPVKVDECDPSPSPPEYVNVKVAERAPVAVGVNVAFTVQLEFEARVDVQVLLDVDQSP